MLILNIIFKDQIRYSIFYTLSPVSHKIIVVVARITAIQRIILSELNIQILNNKFIVRYINIVNMTMSVRQIHRGQGSLSIPEICDFFFFFTGGRVSQIRLISKVQRSSPRHCLFINKRWQQWGSNFYTDPSLVLVKLTERNK